MTYLNKIILIMCFCLSSLSVAYANEQFICIIHDVIITKNGKVIIYASTENKDLTQDGQTNYYRAINETNPLPFSIENIFDTEYYLSFNKQEDTIAISNQLYHHKEAQTYEYKKNNTNILLNNNNGFKNIVITTKDSLITKEIRVNCTEDIKNTSAPIISQNINENPLFENIFFYKVK